MQHENISVRSKQGECTFKELTGPDAVVDPHFASGLSRPQANLLFMPAIDTLLRRSSCCDA